MYSMFNRKSASFIEIEEKLREVEARIIADRKRREEELKTFVEQARRDAEAIQKTKSQQKPLNPSDTTGPRLQKPLASPLIPNISSSPRITREIPETSLFLLRDLWSHLGYYGESFVEMQMEISRELDRADFARFEREMICNEVIGTRAEINMLRDERTQLLKRLDLNRENTCQLIETQERTYKTLMAERVTSANIIRGLENEIRDRNAANQGARDRIATLSNELERAEQTRIATVLCAKGAEERASVANATALAAVQVANQQRDHVPPINPTTPSTAQGNEALKNKLKEQILAVEEEKIASQLASVQEEREKLKNQTKEPSNAAAENKSPLLSAISQLVHNGLFN
ncbi:hypothetical protein PGT21_021392 [Puccinia graminis f. sp. tritici]|uniref:Uncharacterized protein n=1 Tax=Puccinia graminis f. sp. tritici TaxID=56615 RepID=A0A5B0NCN7_PUCGR|nr:hypothetical protein PGT21_021392 [Puccinia graminis f. sp. tritici]KAA1112123.1 hypothetical protein PGTUg99_002566 [Puccinia graminis f. sp. tritici]